MFINQCCKSGRTEGDTKKAGSNTVQEESVKEQIKLSELNRCKESPETGIETLNTWSPADKPPEPFTSIVDDSVVRKITQRSKTLNELDSRDSLKVKDLAG